MAMASREAPNATRSTIPHYIYFFFLIVTLATVSTPALAGKPPPSTFVVYDHQDATPPDQTAVTVASPSGNLNVLEFGTAAVIANVLRKGAAADSPALGVVDGLIIVEKDSSVYTSITYVLNTDSFAGTISAQGVLASTGNGEIAITGGTGDFRFVKGYIDITTISVDLADTVFKTVFFIKYD